MNWLGKACGGAVGFMLGGPLGAALGTALGHRFDKNSPELEYLREPPLQPDQQQRVQSAFFTATFSVMGHLAKADGVVSAAEIRQAEAVMAHMELSVTQRTEAIRLFRAGKHPDFPLDTALERFRGACQQRHSLIRMFIDIQLQLALADGTLSEAEDRLLLYICSRLHFSRLQYEHLKALLMAQQRFYTGSRPGSSQAGPRPSPRKTPQDSLQTAYAMLGITAGASDAEVKRAYRRLLSQNHPDKLVAKGLPAEMMKMATEKTQKIRKAYEMIQQSRGL